MNKIQTTNVINTSNIPDDLKILKQWVLWKLENRSGRSTKIPYQRNGKHAKTNDPATWSSFGDAMATLKSSEGLYTGIGFVFTEDDLFWGIDVDQCASNGKLCKEVLPYLDSLNSYTEWSPSHKGLHVIIKADKTNAAGLRIKSPAANIKEIEIYPKGRFFTVTGAKLEEYSSSTEYRNDELLRLIEELDPNRQLQAVRIQPPARELHLTEGISSESDESIIAKCMNSKWKVRFNSLYFDGDISTYDNDRSRADIALCNLLINFTRDNNQIDRLFIKSALNRPKWCSKRGDITYGLYTINTALNSIQSQNVEITAEAIRKILEALDDPDIIFHTFCSLAARSSINQIEEDKLISYAAGKADIKPQQFKSTIKNLRINKKSTKDNSAANSTIESFGPDNLVYSKNLFWRWNDSGVWKKTNDLTVKNSIHNVLNDDELKEPKVKSILELTKTKCFDEDIEFANSFDGINCLNGELIWDSSGWRLTAHKRESYLINQIPITYDPEATAPRFVQFLEEIFASDSDKDDKKLLILEFIGYTLQSNCKLEAFILLIGEGGNGKSVLLALIKILCGPENTVAVGLDELDNPFDRAELFGKLANIVTEIPKGAILNDAQLKSITSNELMKASFKYQPIFHFEPFCTCWFGTNHLPQTRDYSSALRRRTYIVHFNETFTGKSKDRNLITKLGSEASGILNLVLEAFGNVLKRNDFTQPASTVEAGDRWLKQCNPLKQFIDEICERGKHRISKQVFFSAYEQWCYQKGYQPLTKHKLSGALEALGVLGGRSNSERYYEGITIPSPL